MVGSFPVSLQLVLTFLSDPIDAEDPTSLEEDLLAVLKVCQSPMFSIDIFLKENL